MLKTVIKLLILAAACAGVYYYVHSNHIDLKALFSSNCSGDCCHASSGCSIDNKPVDVRAIDEAATPTEVLTPEAPKQPEFTPVEKAESVAMPNKTATEVAQPSKAPITEPLNKAINTKA